MLGRRPWLRDGNAGDANYGAIGTNYSDCRQPEPRIAALIVRALGEARTVLSVGAGAGSYEPVDRAVTAVEPSASMRAQRPAHLLVLLCYHAGKGKSPRPEIGVSHSLTRMKNRL